MKIQLTKSLLRPLQISDAQFLALHANNKKVADNLRDVFPHPYLLADAEFFIANFASDTTHLTLGIIIAGQAAGTIGIHPQTDVYRENAELGYWLGEKYWGKGIVTEAVHAVVHHAFEQYPIHRIYAQVFEHNKASIRVLEKCKFTHEATLRKAVIKHNKIMDEYIYTILK
jgi:[ribosomal protein S5]-alanine N-acetyltransferase